MHIRAAHRHRPDFEQNLVITDLGNGDFAELDGVRLERVVNNGGVGRFRHGLHLTAKFQPGDQERSTR